VARNSWILFAGAIAKFRCRLLDNKWLRPIFKLFPAQAEGEECTMLRKRLASLGLVFGMLAMFPTLAIAHVLTAASATANCTGYTLTVDARDLTKGTSYTIKYSFTLTSSGGTTTVPGTITFTATGSTATETTSGTWSLAGDYTVTGSATLTSSGSTKPIIINSSTTATLDCAAPPPACSTGPQSLSYNVSESSKNASEIVWFNSHFKLQGSVPSTDFTVNVTNQTISFGPSTLTVPDAVITFSSAVNCASTSFNTSTNTWETSIPLSYATHADEIFSAGLAYLLPTGFPQNVSNVTWHATFTSPTASSLQFQFQYGAANYLSSNDKGDVFPLSSTGQPDYNAMMIDPVHNAPTCNDYNNGDHSGTPENQEVKNLVTGGGSGGGGSNWTGSWSSTPTYVCAAP
jgi:hypothetical protein